MISKRISELCKEYYLIENYEQAVNDETQVWDCHHRIEVSEDGMHTIYTAEELFQACLMFNRPPEELIFLTKKDHRKLHNNTIEYKQKMSKSCSVSFQREEYKQKMSKSCSVSFQREEYKQKMSKSCSGEKNGFYGRKHSEESKQKMSKKLKELYKKKMEN